MSTMLRICLIVASVLTMAMMMHKIRRSRVRTEDAIFWVLFSLVLIVFSVFPGLAYLLSDLVGTQAPSNFIFTLVIFLLLVKVFSLTVRLSQTEMKLQELVQRIALEETEKNADRKARGNTDGNAEEKVNENADEDERKR
ncbi:MAG: DUF2304 domain-containing protein [Clostridiales bacterium]|nr:DUF2304 domain-containing protein [Clostridiales bacterium]